MPRPDAFDVLYHDYYLRVFGLCRRLLGSTERAEDAAQETFTRAFRRFDSFDASQPFWQWIATIANNHCIDLLRQQQRAAALFAVDEADLEQVAAATPTPVTRVIADEDAEAVNRAIAMLPDKYRVPLVLAYFHDASYEAIAEHLSITRNHVGVLLLRGRQQLRNHLEPAAAEPKR